SWVSARQAVEGEVVGAGPTREIQPDLSVAGVGASQMGKIGDRNRERIGCGECERQTVATAIAIADREMIVSGAKPFIARANSRAVIPYVAIRACPSFG